MMLPSQTPAPRAVPVQGSRAPTAAQMLDAARAVREELQDQQERIQDQRQDVLEEMNQFAPGSTERAGLEARLKDLDARNAALDQQLATADQRVADAAGVPGATIEPPRVNIVRTGPPEEVWVMAGLVIMFVLAPISFAWSRRLWRRGSTAPAELPAELGDRLGRLEQAVDAVAVELERVGEGQRYATRILEQSRALGAGPAQPIDVREREGVRQARP